MQTNNISLEKERDLGEIITDTFSFIRLQFKDLSQVFMQTILPILLLSVAAGVYYQYASQDLFGDSFFSENSFKLFTNIGGLLLPFLVYIFSALFFYVISYNAILGCMKSYQEFGKIDLAFVKETIKSHFWSMTGLLIVASLMLALGFMLCIVPFFYIIVPVSIMFPILVFENKSVGDSINHAFQLIKENFWPTLGTIVVFFLISFLASGIFQLPIIVYSFISTITKLEASSMNLETLAETDWVLLTLTAFGNLGSSIFSLVSIIVFGLIYYNLNEKQNLTGLAKDIDTIGKN